MWNLRAHLLDTVEMPLEHTGINLADELKDTLKRWNLKDSDLVSIPLKGGILKILILCQ